MALGITLGHGLAGGLSAGLAPFLSMSVQPLSDQTLFGQAFYGQARAQEAPRPPGTLDRFLGNQPQFVHLPAFNITVIRDGRVSRMVSVGVVLESLGIAHRDKIFEHRQKLYDAFLRDLHGVLSIQGNTEDQFNLETIRIRLQRRADSILGPGVVRNVLIESTFARNPG